MKTTPTYAVHLETGDRMVEAYGDGSKAIMKVVDVQAHGRSYVKVELDMATMFYGDTAEGPYGQTVRYIPNDERVEKLSN